jgi:ABC-type antimicrobial peptide transport system permease subunit
LRLTLVGVFLGAALTVGAASLVRSQLVGISPSDPVSILGGVTLLVLVAAGACAVPAWRALRIDPVSALRSQ